MSTVDMESLGNDDLDNTIFVEKLITMFNSRDKALGDRAQRTSHIFLKKLFKADEEKMLRPLVKQVLKSMEVEQMLNSSKKRVKNLDLLNRLDSDLVFRDHKIIIKAACTLLIEANGVSKFTVTELISEIFNMGGLSFLNSPAYALDFTVREKIYRVLSASGFKNKLARSDMERMNGHTSRRQIKCWTYETEIGKDVNQAFIRAMSKFKTSLSLLELQQEQMRKEALNYTTLDDYLGVNCD